MTFVNDFSASLRNVLIYPTFYHRRRQYFFKIYFIKLFATNVQPSTEDGNLLTPIIAIERPIYSIFKPKTKMTLKTFNWISTYPVRSATDCSRQLRTPERGRRETRRRRKSETVSISSSLARNVFRRNDDFPGDWSTVALI